MCEVNNFVVHVFSNDSGCMDWSAVYILYRVGDKTAPCDTPARIGEILKISAPELTAKKCLFK